jgi:hypothetical protein
MLKENYLAAIERAGFQEVQVKDEASFGLDCMLNDPTAKALIEHHNLTPEETRRIAQSVVSIKVCGIKPKGMEG